VIDLETNPPEALFHAACRKPAGMVAERLRRSMPASLSPSTRDISAFS
jgi:hypothetical protein